MEILGYLEKVFFDGNSKLPGGKYTLTFINIENGEKIELNVKLDAKENFIVGVIYRIEYIIDNNEIINIVLMYESIEDFKNKIVSYRNYNYIKNPNQYKIKLIKYGIFAIIVIMICQIIRILI